MVEKDYKTFLYKKLNEVSEKKEEFCQLNTALIEENQQLKEANEKLLEEQKNIDWLEGFLLKEEEQLEERSMADQASKSLIAVLDRLARQSGDDEKLFKKQVIMDLYRKYVDKRGI